MPTPGRGASSSLPSLWSPSISGPEEGAGEPCGLLPARRCWANVSPTGRGFYPPPASARTPSAEPKGAACAGPGRSLAGPEGALGFRVLFLVWEPQRALWLFADSPHFR